MLCKGRSVTIMKLESDLSLGSGTVAKWDKAIPKADTLVKVADYFNVSVDYLLGRTDDPTPKPIDKKEIASAEAIALANKIVNLPDAQRALVEQQIKIFAEMDKK